MKREPDIAIRRVVPEDLEWMFQLQLDPESNRMASTIPRVREDFFIHWGQVCQDPSVVAKVVLVGGEKVGCVVAFPRDGQTHVAYWISPDRWGQGIATAALRLLLVEIDCRPLHATVAVTNRASLRVLAKCGFQRQGSRQVAASDRHPAGTDELLVLP